MATTSSKATEKRIAVLAKAIDASAAGLMTKAGKSSDKGFANLLQNDAAGMRCVAMHLRAGRVASAIDAAFNMETGARDEFPVDLWKLGVETGLVETRPNGRRVLYVQI